jgi:hypothetical protein
MQSLIMVSFPVEVWKQPRVPDSGAAYLDLVVEPMIKESRSGFGSAPGG